MEKYKNNLEELITNIQNNTISKNEVIVGELSSQVMLFLKSKSIVVSGILHNPQKQVDSLHPQKFTDNRNPLPLKVI